MHSQEKLLVDNLYFSAHILQHIDLKSGLIDPQIVFAVFLTFVVYPRGPVEAE